MAQAGRIEIPIKVTTEFSDRNFSSYRPANMRERMADLAPSESVGRLHQDLVTITKRLLTMWVDKIKGYGASRHADNELDFDVWMCYCDVHRKHNRLEQLTRLVADGQMEYLDPLIDAYADIALYAISNIQTLENRK